RSPTFDVFVESGVSSVPRISVLSFRNRGSEALGGGIESDCGLAEGVGGGAWLSGGIWFCGCFGSCAAGTAPGGVAVLGVAGFCWRANAHVANNSVRQTRALRVKSGTSAFSNLERKLSSAGWPITKTGAEAPCFKRYVYPPDWKSGFPRVNSGASTFPRLELEGLHVFPT